MVARALKDIIERAEAWPEEDQAELIELAREIEARRAGTYVMNAEERAAVERARSGGFATDDEMAAFWRRFGVQ